MNIHANINSKGTKELFRALYHSETFKNKHVLTKRFLGTIKAYNKRNNLTEKL